MLQDRREAEECLASCAICRLVNDCRAIGVTPQVLLEGALVLWNGPGLCSREIGVQRTRSWFARLVRVGRSVRLVQGWPSVVFARPGAEEALCAPGQDGVGHLEVRGSMSW